LRVSIIGSGFVGTATGIGLSRIGNSVIFYDISRNRVQNLLNSNIRATYNMSEAVEESDISVISVPTPFDGKQMNLKYIKSAVAALAKSLAKKKNVSFSCAREERIDIGNPLSYFRALKYLADKTPC
jgi:UDPglucose 6-dehydrogenase